MTTVLVVAPPLPDAPTLVADLIASGMHVLARCECADLVREAVQHAPDVVVVWEAHPGTDAQSPLFAAVRLLASVQARPVLVFTSEVSAEAMEVSLQAGISSWVVNGYSRDRLRPLIQYTLARGRHAAALQAELAELRVRYEERRLVDRAKGILMAAQRVSEDEAFRLLRTASMQAKQRIGQVSQQVIDAAQYADAINQAGRLRMLSQRIVKLQALALAGVEAAGSRALLATSRAQVQAILEHLQQVLSRPSFGDLLDAALAAWTAMRAALDEGATGTARQAQLAGLDAHAGQLLTAAEQLTGALEGAGLATSLHVINVSGRQRMHAQRLAKQALLGAPPKAIAETVAAFDEGLDYLQRIPLSTPAIRMTLAQAVDAWQQLRSAAAQGPTPSASVAMAASSEALLDHFDQLTSDYERSMQLLIG